MTTRPTGPRPRHARRLTALGVGVALTVSGLTAAVPALTGLTGQAAAAPLAAGATGVDGDGTFTIAVLPDTQQEVGNPKDKRFTDRAQWLADHKTELDLRYVTHVGDVVNWDTADHAQYQVTKPGVAILDASGVPWSFSIGNHDTMATGSPGGARPGGDAEVDVRTTKTFNSYFGISHAKDLRGAYEANKIDNSYSTFVAEGETWLVLNLELWPRQGAVRWAQKVVENHPNANVAVVTHAFLNADGSVQQDAGGYGATSPQYLLDNLVRKYANVRFVFSGHAGTFAVDNLTGVHGNPVSIVQTCYHSNTTNPVRLVTIDTRHDTYSSKVYAPFTDQTFTDGSATSRSGMAWV